MESILWQQWEIGGECEMWDRSFLSYTFTFHVDIPLTAFAHHHLTKWSIIQYIFYFHCEQETHILHTFDGDLYGQILKLCICGYLRPEANFDSLDALIAAIQKDIKDARDYLDTEPFHSYRNNEIFKDNEPIPNWRAATTNLTIS